MTTSMLRMLFDAAGLDEDVRHEGEGYSSPPRRPVGYDGPPLSSDERTVVGRFEALGARDRRLVLEIVRRVMEIEDEGGEDVAEAMIERVMLIMRGTERLS